MGTSYSIRLLHPPATLVHKKLLNWCDVYEDRLCLNVIFCFGMCAYVLEALTQGLSQEKEFFQWPFSLSWHILDTFAWICNSLTMDPLSLLAASMVHGLVNEYFSHQLSSIRPQAIYLFHVAARPYPFGRVRAYFEQQVKWSMREESERRHWLIDDLNTCIFS